MAILKNIFTLAYSSAGFIINFIWATATEIAGNHQAQDQTAEFEKFVRGRKVINFKPSWRISSNGLKALGIEFADEPTNIGHLHTVLMCYAQYVRRFQNIGPKGSQHNVTVYLLKKNIAACLYE
jgi:hypothetical protein